MSSQSENPQTEGVLFDALGLSQPILDALNKLGYETPSPIQARAIPVMLEGGDILGQAQTGTGKTAAFALPVLSQIQLKEKLPQVLVLAPTRELAIQVAEAFQQYAMNLPGFHVLPIYGGQDYRMQTRPLQRGVQVVVGTPGRVMDHMRKGTLKLDNLKTLILDEADEMLRMGFIDDVEWVLEQSPEGRQIALFSATMPKEIRKIADQYLQNPTTVMIKSKTTTADTIRQRYWMVSGVHKLDALTRILEAETFDGMVIFVRTKIETVELSDRLQARGFQAAPLNGDIVQKDRERTVKKLKEGQLDILVATDVAARGLDVERISHVVNYDIPSDTEAYTHRIGRTGRAGRTGEAILFVSPREKRMLYSIERATRQKIELMELPSTDVINDQRVARFKQKIVDQMNSGEDLDFYQKLVEQVRMEQDAPAAEIAAALARLLQGDTPLLLKEKPVRKKSERGQYDRDKGLRGDRPERGRRERSESRGDRYGKGEKRGRSENRKEPEEGMQRYRMDVGYDQGVKPGNIVGAIANEADLDSKYIGQIEIQDSQSFVDLPEGMPPEVLRILKKARVAGKPMNLSPTGDSKYGQSGKPEKPRKKGKLSRKPRPKS